MISEGVAVGFITRNLMDRGLVSLWEDERFAAFRGLVADGKKIAAAQAYQIVTGAGLQECHLAVELATVALDTPRGAR